MTDPFHPRSPEPKELDAALGRLLTPPSSPPPAPSTVRGLRKTLREERARLWCAGPIGAPLGAVLTLPRPGRIEMLLGTPLGPADDPAPLDVVCCRHWHPDAKATTTWPNWCTSLRLWGPQRPPSWVEWNGWLSCNSFVQLRYQNQQHPLPGPSPSNQASRGATVMILTTKSCTACCWRRTLTRRIARGFGGAGNQKIF